MATGTTRSFLGIHHLKLPANNLDKTLAFYTTHLPFTHLPALDHTDASTGAVYAKILTHAPSHTTIEIRDHPEQAAKERRWDPVTWAVEGRADLEEWRAYFASVGVLCSRVLTGAKGWLLCVEDPDGRRVRFYTREEHEMMTSGVDHDAYWLDN